MMRIITKDIRTILFSKRFWIAVGALIAFAFINVINVKIQFAINSRGGADLFAFGNIFSPLAHYIGPFIPAFVLGPLVVDDIKSEAFSAQKVNFKKYLTAHSISSFVIGGGIFVVAYLIMLVGCFIFDPAMKVVHYEPFGIFRGIFSSSPLLYILLFILYSALFGAIYAFFSAGIGIISKKVWMAMVLPGIIYYCARYLWPYFDNPLLSWAKFLPGLANDFDSSVPLGRRGSELGVVLLVAVTLVVISYFRLKKETLLNSNDDTQKKVGI